MQAKAEAQISTNNSGRAAMSTSRCLNGAMAGDRLQDVFQFTVRSITPLTKPLVFADVAAELVKTFHRKITGININHQGKAVEISFVNDNCVCIMLDLPLILPSHPPIYFKRSYDDSLDITFYNVPLNSTGVAEKILIENAGAKVTACTTVSKTINGIEVITGERRFSCSGRSTFTYLPTVVKLYSGRLLGCRYRGQAHDLATKVPNRSLKSALAASSNWGAADVSFFNQPIEPRSRSGTMETHVTRSRSSTVESIVTEEQSLAVAVENTTISADLPPVLDPVKVDIVAPPPPEVQPTAITSHSRNRSDSQISLTAGFSDGGRSRSPIRSGSSCPHRCRFCDSIFNGYAGYSEHLQVTHPDQYIIIMDRWKEKKKHDKVSYRQDKLAATCPTCNRFSITGLNPPGKIR